MMPASAIMLRCRVLRPRLTPLAGSIEAVSPTSSSRSSGRLLKFLSSAMVGGNWKTGERFYCGGPASFYVVWILCGRAW
jgi:hypothetical protein